MVVNTKIESKPSNSPSSTPSSAPVFPKPQLTLPMVSSENTSLSFTPEMIKRAEQFTNPHTENIKAACADYNNICSPKLLAGIVFAHQLLEQHHGTSNKNAQEPAPKTTYDPKSLKEMANEVSENLKCIYFSRVESEHKLQDPTYDDLVATMEKMTESETKISLAQYYSHSIQQNHDSDGLAYQDVVGLAQDAVHHENKDSMDWQEIKKHIDSSELVAFVENAYNYSQKK